MTFQKGQHVWHVFNDQVTEEIIIDITDFTPSIGTRRGCSKRTSFPTREEAIKALHAMKEIIMADERAV